MSQILFNRTVKTNIIIYPTDGTGRDGYITFNNAGFWKDNIKRYSLQEKYKRSSFARFHSIRKIPPSWKYHSDGTGRDTYILHNYGGLINNYKAPNLNIFRICDENSNENPLNKKDNNYYVMSSDEKRYQKKISKIQKDVINRLYYKPKEEYKFNHLRRENSYGNVFTKLKLEPIKKNHICDDNQKNIINNDVNRRYFFNNNELRNGNYLNKIFNDEKNDYNEKSRNKLALLNKYRIKCLSNNFDEKINHYPFNQFNKKMMNLTRSTSNRKYNLFNY